MKTADRLTYGLILVLVFTVFAALGHRGSGFCLDHSSVAPAAAHSR